MSDYSALASRINALPTITSTVNVGMITPPAVMPADCLSSLWNFGILVIRPYNPFSWTAYTVGCAISSCCPSSQKPNSRPYEWLENYHSPAVCPQDYRTCPGPGNLTPAPGETLAFCCPKNFRCPGPGGATTEEWWACQSNIDSTTVAYLMDNLKDQRTLGTEIISVFRFSYGSPPTTYNMGVVAYPIQIRWRAEDRLPTQTSSSSGNGAPFPTASRISPSVSSPSNLIRVSGLSTGAKVGIGLGVAIFGLIVLGVAALWWIKRRRYTPAMTDAPSAAAGDSTYTKPELEATTTARRPVELASD